jgi:UDP:flavonoid glycosyltransferase YjiC (YdhE family)
MWRRTSSESWKSVSGLPDLTLLPRPENSSLHSIVILGAGSRGDFFPVFRLGSRLAERGYGVAMLTYPSRRTLVEGRGMVFVEYPESLLHYRGPTPGWLPKALAESRYAQDVLWLWRKRSVTESQTLFLVACLERMQQLGWRWFVGPEWCHGVREFAERNPGALIHILLTPASIHSTFSGSAIPEPPFGGLPRRLYRRLYWLVSDLAFALTLGLGQNRARWRMGLPPQFRLRKGWAQRYGETLGLFAKWFAPAEPDWPPLVHTGFLLPPAVENSTVPADLLRFLQERPTVVFTCGAQHYRALRFFQVGKEVAATGTFRVLILGGAEDPAGAETEDLRRLPFFPLMDLLPHCAAIVHHGGIGTTVQAILADLPQIVVPGSLDQWDQAERVTRLGVGVALRMRDFRCESTLALLRDLIASREGRARRKECAAAERANDAEAEAVAFLERRFTATARPACGSSPDLS